MLSSLFQPEILETKLSTLNVEGVCKLISNMDDLNPEAVPKYVQTVKDQNINGRVLLYCDLDELKKVVMISNIDNKNIMLFL